MLNPQLVGNGRVLQRVEVQRERLETRLHLALGHDQNAWNVDGLLHDQVDVFATTAAMSGFSITPSSSICDRRSLLLDRLDDGGLDLRLLQIRDGRQRLRLVLQLADYLVSDLRDLLLLGLRERRRFVLPGDRRAAGDLRRA